MFSEGGWVGGWVGGGDGEIVQGVLGTVVARIL